MVYPMNLIFALVLGWVYVTIAQGFQYLGKYKSYLVKYGIVIHFLFIIFLILYYEGEKRGWHQNLGYLIDRGIFLCFNSIALPLLVCMLWNTWNRIREKFSIEMKLTVIIVGIIASSLYYYAWFLIFTTLFYGFRL